METAALSTPAPPAVLDILILDAMSRNRKSLSTMNPTSDEYLRRIHCSVQLLRNLRHSKISDSEISTHAIQQAIETSPFLSNLAARIQCVGKIAWTVHSCNALLEHLSSAAPRTAGHNRALLALSITKRAPLSSELYLQSTARIYQHLTGTGDTVCSARCREAVDALLPIIPKTNRPYVVNLCQPLQGMMERLSSYLRDQTLSTQDRITILTGATSDQLQLPPECLPTDKVINHLYETTNKCTACAEKIISLYGQTFYNQCLEHLIKPIPLPIDLVIPQFPFILDNIPGVTSTCALDLGATELIPVPEPLEAVANCALKNPQLNALPSAEKNPDDKDI